MWSIYDTMLLITGFLTAAIALIPIPAIESKTRVLSAAIGAGIVLLSILLGSLSSFTYPALVMIGPLFPLLAGGAISKSALDRQKALDALSSNSDSPVPQHNEHYQSNASVVSATATPFTATAISTSEPMSPATSVDPAGDRRASAWTELFEPLTSPERLAEIAAAYPEFASAIGEHPSAYPELRAWARSLTHPGQTV